MIRRGEGPFSFLLLGDPGEGDNSQYAVVPPLLAESEGTDFTVICSDVIYPAGELADYRNKFFRPYRDLECPIYAVPGQPRLVRRAARLHVARVRDRRRRRRR